MRGWWMVVEKLRRVVRTLIFVVAMVASLLVSSMPVLVALADVAVLCVLVSSFTCLNCYGLKQHLLRYDFRRSLADVPLVSALRSFIIICVYSLCDTPALSHGPYLGTVILCSMVSILLLSIKACVFTVNSHIEAEALSSFLSLSRKNIHMKKSWAMPVLFLSSVVFAFGHIVVAYRTSCRARRKLIFHRVDPESVLTCKNVFCSFHKAPRSPTPAGGRTPRSDNEIKRKPLGLGREEAELPIRLLAEIDSLFITCQGLTIHYKVCLPGSPPRSLFTATFFEANPSCSTPNMTLGGVKPEKHISVHLSNTDYNLTRSHSNQFYTSSLYAPLLEGAPTYTPHSHEIPVFCLDELVDEDEISKSSGGTVEEDMVENDQFGIVLVHGFGGGVFSWRHVMGPLARQVGCTVAAFDRPGWGLTCRPRRKEWEDKDLPNPYKLDSQVDLLLSFCSEMGFSSVVLVGHDDGGLLALKAVERVQTSLGFHSVIIKGVILLNVSLSREVVPGFARILLRTTLGKKHMVRPLLRTEIIQVVNRRAWYDATKLTTETLNLYKAPLCVEGWDEALHEIGKLSCETVLPQQISASLLKSVEDMPLLVIAGAEDVLVPLKSSQVMASKLSNSRLVAISGCGHLPHEECPKALVAAVSPFISRLLTKQDLENQV